MDDITRLIHASARGLVEARHRREDACGLPHDAEADLAVMSQHVRDVRKAMLATQVTVQLEEGMVFLCDLPIIPGGRANG